MSKILVAYSGGKDSHACLLWSIKQYGVKNIEAVFCDTGWEHPETYSHIHKTTDDLGVKLVTVKSKKYNGMVDLAEKKKRFPSSKARFCTSELKSIPFIDYVLEQKEHLIIIQGIRALESHNRSKMQKQCRYFKYYFESAGIDKKGKPKFEIMRTNLEKWNYYKALVNAKEKEFIDNNIKDIPNNFYEISPSGKIKILKVTNIIYRNKLYADKKPTRADVEKIKQYLENMPELTIEKVSVCWECREEKWKCSGAVRYLEIKNKYSMSEEDAKRKAHELLEMKRKEKHMLENGHVKCAYCSKVISEKEAVNYEIIFQNSRPDPFSRNGYKKFVDRKTNKYCNNGCGANDQMAHEG